MCIENTCNTCEGCGDRECKKFELGNIDTYGFCCDTVISGCHDSTSASGVYKVLYDEQCKKDQKDSDREKVMFDIFVKSTCSGDTKRTFEDLFAACFQFETCGTCCYVKSFFVKTDIQDVDQVLDDLTECQGYDRKVVTTKSKYRDTDNHTKHGCYCCADQDRQDKSRNLRDIACDM